MKVRKNQGRVYMEDCYKNEYSKIKKERNLVKDKLGY